jgi:hypothetical protein
MTSFVSSIKLPQLWNNKIVIDAAYSLVRDADGIFEIDDILIIFKNLTSSRVRPTNDGYLNWLDIIINYGSFDLNAPILPMPRTRYSYDRPLMTSDILTRAKYPIGTVLLIRPIEGTCPHPTEDLTIFQQHSRYTSDIYRHQDLAC